MDRVLCRAPILFFPLFWVGLLIKDNYIRVVFLWYQELGGR